MTLTMRLIFAVLFWIAVDVNLISRRQRLLFSGRKGAVLNDDLESIEKKLKRKVQKRTSPIPNWIQLEEVKYKPKVNYFSTKSRDHRDSNQRSIRRKCINA